MHLDLHLKFLQAPTSLQSSSTTTSQSSGTKSIPCKFFAQGTCFKGSDCNFLHESPQEIPNKIEGDQQCAICMENIKEKNRKFGLLVGCEHVFCLDCIREWRKQAEKISLQSAARSCPICRKTSNYIIPSDDFQIGEEKMVLDILYKEHLASLPCKYFKSYGTCPFRENCFYDHSK